jgi:LmbE family N-acetylglucosaminyl deacetylase
MKSMGRCASKPSRGAARILRAAAALALALLSTAIPMLAGTSVTAAAASPPACASKAMYVVAHEDDSLLFQSPDLLQDIRSGRCVRTVFLTAGDDGQEESYWISREEGAEAGYARMAGVADTWTGSTVTADGHPIRLETLTGQPGVSLVFMRLPDGGYPAGEGTPAYGNQSLMKLWNGGNGGSPSESDISTVAEEVPATYATTYDFDELVDALAALMTSFEPRWIATQNYTGTFATSVDHHDHVATAKFTQRAQSAYAAPHQLIGYEDYETSAKANNLSGEPLAAKEAAFAAYEEHDKACTEGSECKAQYKGWLERQYVAAAETAGVVANAGYAQTASSGDTVGLDGSRSSAEGGGPLSYQWTQVAGPTVELSNALAEKPSFVAPPAAASLSFSLTASKGMSISDPDVVNVRVEGPDPTPTAVAGPAQSAAGGARVILDGSHSINPYGTPLEYKWTQIAGPAVGLAGASGATPSFTAPPGPSSLAFSLVVTNAAASSAPATVGVAVSAAPSSSGGSPPPASPMPSQAGGSVKELRLSPQSVELVLGKRTRTRRVVSVLGPSPSRVRCTGRLPKGARCRTAGEDRIAIEAAPSTRRTGLYHLTVHIESTVGTVERKLAVRLRAPGHRRDR